MTPEQAEAIYNDEQRDKECQEYLIASVLAERAILDRLYADKPDKKRPPEPDRALNTLLAAGVVFLSTNWWKEDWPEDAKKTTALCVNCNDMFAWGCADAEDLHLHEVHDLFDHWLKDPAWGAIIWCIKKRKMMPQPPVERMIRCAGVWNLDEMGLEESPFADEWDEASLARYGKLEEKVE